MADLCYQFLTTNDLEPEQYVPVGLCSRRLRSQGPLGRHQTESTKVECDVEYSRLHFDDAYKNDRHPDAPGILTHSELGCRPSGQLGTSPI